MCNYMHMTSYITEPSDVRSIQVTRVTHNSAVLTWVAPSHPNGIILNYSISISIQNIDSLQSYSELKVLKEPFGTTSLQLVDLKSYRTYKFVISAMTSAGEGNLTASTFTTRGFTPGPPSNISAVPSNSRSIIINWSYPEHPEGIIRGYLVQVSLFLNFSATDLSFQQNITLEPANNRSRVSTTAERLAPYSGYYIKVQAYAYEDEPNNTRYGAEAVLGPVYTPEAGML